MRRCLTAEAAEIAEKHSNIHQGSISVWQSELEDPKGSHAWSFRRHSCGGRNPGLVGAAAHANTGPNLITPDKNPGNELPLFPNSAPSGFSAVNSSPQALTLVCCFHLTVKRSLAIL
jgi:hypothetical protein